MAIDSVVAQTLEDWEMIVVDDGSDDRWLPEKLAVALERFNHAPNSGILLADYWRLDGEERHLGSTYMFDHLDRRDTVPLFARARAALDVRRPVDIERLTGFEVYTVRLDAPCCGNRRFVLPTIWPAPPGTAPRTWCFSPSIL